jgi:hypothetical protein
MPNGFDGQPGGVGIQAIAQLACTTTHFAILGVTKPSVLAALLTPSEGYQRDRQRPVLRFQRG